MLDIRWIRENPQALADALVKRGESSDSAQKTVDDILARDEDRRAHLGELQEKQERRNAASKEIGNAMRAGDMKRAEALKAEVADIKSFVQNGEAEERRLDAALQDALAVVPNIPLDEVPVGADETENVEIRVVGEKPRGSFTPKQHYEIGEALGQMDFETAAKLSGSRFTVLSGQLARLERALGQFMLDLHTTEHGYTEVQPPLLVRDEAMYGTGQLPKFKEDLFPALSRFHDHEAEKTALIENALKSIRDAVLQSKGNPSFADRVTNEGSTFRRVVTENVEANFPKDEHLWLIPTAEVPLSNLVRESIVEQDALPLRYTALTPCFRSEAGSAGKDTRGMLRQHQFNKVELVSVTDQETSLEEHERMTDCAETVLKKLGLPFRTVVLCTGDMGFGARKTYDIEVWLPGQGAYREISSCSVCGDFQARRMNARYRAKEDRSNRFVHTLNGSGVAVGRALIAVLENCQNADGSVTIPEALHAYTGGMTKIEAVKG